MEEHFLNLIIVSLIIPIINAVVNPQPFQKDAHKCAKSRGHDKGVIILTRACQHLTLYSQFWTIIALYYKTPLTMFVAQTMSILVFFLYHGFNYFDSKHLAYHPKELVEQVINIFPPMNKYIVVWMGLHFQHSVFPFYIYYISRKYDLNNYEPHMLFYSFTVMTAYILFFNYCWKVQGIAAYPFLNELNKHSSEFLFYCSGFIVFMIINCIVCGMYNELFFYVLGIINLCTFLVIKMIIFGKIE